MSTKTKAIASKSGLITSPQAPLISTFIAVILGASLIEFNELLFPPKVTSLNFWALVVPYYGAIALWFGIATMSRHRPYTDTFLARVWITCGIFQLIAYLGVMYFAASITDSLLAYMWGWVAIYLFLWLSIYIRYLDLRLPEPNVLCAIHGVLILAVATAYSIWVQFFSPVPSIANWVFVFVTLAVTVSFRQLLRMRHAWQPSPTEQQ